jgi:hypothetical protein
MIRVSHVLLPPGLNVLARRGSGSELIVLVSAALPADRQRAAVRVALRAARRTDGRTRLLPLPGIAILAASWLWLRRILRACRAHWAVTAGAGVTAIAAAAAVVTFAVVPHAHQPAGAARGAGHSRVRGPAPRAGAPLPQPSRRSGAAGSQVTPGGPTPTSSAQPRIPGSSPSPAPSASPATSPSASPSSSPAPSPSPTPSSSKCLYILGIWVCL